MRDVAETVRTLEYAANADNEEMLRWWKASSRQDCIDLCAYVARLKRIEIAARGLIDKLGSPDCISEYCPCCGERTAVVARGKGPGVDFHMTHTANCELAALEAALKERDDA